MNICDFDETIQCMLQRSPIVVSHLQEAILSMPFLSHLIVTEHITSQYCVIIRKAQCYIRQVTNRIYLLTLIRLQSHPHTGQSLKQVLSKDALASHAARAVSVP